MEGNISTKKCRNKHDQRILKYFIMTLSLNFLTVVLVVVVQSEGDLYVPLQYD